MFLSSDVCVHLYGHVLEYFIGNTLLAVCMLTETPPLRRWDNSHEGSGIVSSPRTNCRVIRNQPVFLPCTIAIQSKPFRTIWKPILLYISHLYPGLSSVSLFQVFEPNCTNLSLLPVHARCPAQHIILIYHPNHVGRDWAIWNSLSWNFLHLMLLTVVQIFSWTPCLRTHSAYVLPLIGETKPGLSLGQDTDYTDLTPFFFSVFPVKFRRVF